ncbi:MAG: hypothetical protein H5U19_14530, partial [Rhodobacteraceae bacterium]|nr:hypothetical protein [Paracoccaceae bacterium]
MAEKRVSVRLAAIGGRLVQSELDAIGAAGKRGLGQVSREAELAQAKLAAFGRRAVIAGAAAAGALIATGVAAIKSGLSNIDAQAKLAQSLGTTVSSMQVLARAGELAGVSMGGIEQATKDLTRRLSQAAAGTGPATKALDALGLSANDLLKLPLDQRVSSINAAIEKFIPAAQQAAVAGQLFGEEGSLLAARLQPDVIRQANDELAKFGVLVGEDQANQIERTNDAVSSLGLVWTGLANQLAVTAAPAIERAAQALADLAQQGSPVNGMVTGLIDVMTVFIENIDTVTTASGLLIGFMGTRWVVGMALATRATLIAVGGVKALTIALAINPLTIALVAVSSLAGGYLMLRDNSDAATEAERMLNEQLAGNAPKATAAAEGAIALARTRREQAKASLDAALAELAVLKAEKARADATSDTPANEGMKSFFSQEVEDTIGLITQLRGTIKELSDAEAALLLTPPPRPLRIDIPPNGDTTNDGATNDGATNDGATNDGATNDGATNAAKNAADAARRAAEALAESSRTDLEVYRAKIAEINELHRRFPEIVTTEVRDRALKQLREDFARTGQEATIMGDTMRRSFVGLTTGALGLSGALRQVIGRLQEMAANSAFDVLIGKRGGGVGGLFGSLGKIGGALGGLFGPGQTTGTGLTTSTPNLLPSFAGGGFTGASSRSGGIDGRGGFPAILHPNEVVTDLTRNRGGGGGGGQRNETRMVVELSPELIARVLDQARQDTVQIVESSFPRFSAN